MNYLKKRFSETELNKDPFDQFEAWFKERPLAEIKEPHAASLATSTPEGHISQRIVLVKESGSEGFIFYTNYNSRKGQELITNPICALLFYWPDSYRQVRVEGRADKISEEDSESYFSTRPLESQLSAWASRQSSVIASREVLENEFSFYKILFKDGTVNKPPQWGGFRLVPDWFEFWQEGDFRLHDRFAYSKKNSIWTIERLAP